MADLTAILEQGRAIFGTDGVRGEAGTELTPELVLEIGRAAGTLLDHGPVLVGRDTRRSGTMLSSALQAGFQAVGIDCLDAGVLPSGGISLLTDRSAARMGAVVSASHNPAPDNGIKLLGEHGTKLPDALEREIEDRLRASGRRSSVGGAIGIGLQDSDALYEYVAYLTDVAVYRLSGLPLTLDCANGAAFKAAPELFNRLKADVEVLAAEPNGMNINDGCGATHPEFLASRTRGRVGLAFDGDADRLIAVDEDGRPANGDVIMAIVARHWKANGGLRNNLVVATVMSNLGFRKSMAEAGIDLVETKVGDRYVMEALLAQKGVLGGEQSGHVIFLDKGRTGDGLLTAVRLLDVMAGTGKELRQLRAEAITEYPQVLENVRIARGTDVEAAASVWEEVGYVEEDLGDDGRVLLRPSGTEPLVRVMVEAPTFEMARKYADRLAAVVADQLGKE
ncbi:MAG TPA: phosphoglucosamine mutase [Acidimicrobiia bacterium]|nr:phosphoglucosamine mutase [Acidimicrobiia bacterium]